jgi:hypothetical protein
MPITPAHPTRNFSQKPTRLFVKGPIPLQWLTTAQKSGGTALAVGILLWHLWGMKDAPGALVVTRKRAKDIMGLGRDALSRGLDRLENAGLVTTTRGRGQAIRVTIRSVSPAEAHPHERG